MKLFKSIVFCLACFSLSFAQSQNVNLIANVNDYPNVGYSDCWGYTAPDGKEYALLGVNNGVSIIDVSDPVNAAEVEFISYVAAPPAGWYDMKTYQNYMYVSSEGKAAVLIVDLSSLPDSAVVVGSLDALSSEPHNIFVDTETGVLYVVEDFHFNPAVRIFSLSNPSNPKQLSSIGIADFGTDAHDIFAQDSVLYIAEGESPSIGIVDVSDPAQPVLLTRLFIPGGGYVHQVWVTEDNHYMVTTEETLGRTIKIWDISDLENIVMVNEYLAPSQIAHNAYFRNDRLYISHYSSGMRILDFSDPTQRYPHELGFYDTYSQSDIADFVGNWGVYPFSPNGLIFASDTETGLYILRFEQEEGPQFVVSQEKVDFGVIEAGDEGMATIMLSNMGTEELVIDDFTLTGETFEIPHYFMLPMELQPKSSAPFWFYFRPTEAGSFSGTLTFSTNDPNDAVTEIALTGKATYFAPAQTGVCYATIGFNDDYPGYLMTIDLTTGEGSLVGPTNVTSDVGRHETMAIAINSKGDMYIAEWGPNTKIYRVDAASGNAVIVANTTLSALQAIAFDNNDELYAASINFTAGKETSDLYNVDLETGESRHIGDVGFNCLGLAVDPTDNTLWASENGDRIFTINTVTGAATLIGAAWTPFATTDLAFDPSGNLFGAIPNQGNPYRLISIDKSSGKGTIIGQTGFRGVAGMAMMHPSREGSHIGATPMAALFDNLEVGFADTLSVKIHSSGTEPLTISEIVLPDAPYSIDNLPDLPLVLQPGENISLDVIFAPTEGGTIADTLRIVSNDEALTQLDIVVRGRGVAIHAAAGETIYAVTGKQQKGVLITVNPENGLGRKVGSTGYEELTGLTIWPATGQLVATVPQEDKTLLVKIDSETGEAFPLIELERQAIRAIAFDGDTLYGASFTSKKLFKINTGSGEMTELGNTGITELSGLAFDLSGQLWGTGAHDDAIYKINKTTAESELVGNSGFSSTHALAFDASGKLLALTGFPPPFTSAKLLQIDPETGVGTSLGSTRFRSVYGLAVSGTVVTGIRQQAENSQPTDYELGRNFPNPFNPTTTIGYALPNSSHVRITLFDVLGRQIKQLVSGTREAGYYHITWDGRDENNMQVAAGVYFYKMEAGDPSASSGQGFVKVNKLVLVR